MKQLYADLETLATRILKEIATADKVDDPAAAESILQIIKFAKANVAKLEKPAVPPVKKLKS